MKKLFLNREGFLNVEKQEAEILKNNGIEMGKYFI
jgi:hypothetical protein